MLLLLIYLASIADKALLALRWCLLGTFIILVILLVCFSAIKFADDEAKFNINLKPYIIGWVVALMVYIAMPSSKTIYILAGTAYIQELAKSESVQEISSDIVEILKLKVKEAKKDLEKGFKQ
ncbi:hypothetical protein [Campylobacter devanensis]|uniref:hypothetical protein n=1 Tax=Campylobacter devanensis TaxID=3161138 RepID=UPI000A34CCAB|nr:hypothetical protein [Campylobacter sp. P0107]